MFCLSRRCLHTSTDDARRRLRELLRETAQSVAVVTAILHDTDARRPTPTYHGATLSSFASIALDPFPLVAFSLRVPSRMASALDARVRVAPSPGSPSVHLVINILSAAQPDIAERFARPDLHPRPFADPEVRWTHSEEGLPVLEGALGALACRLVGPSVKLARLDGSCTLDRTEGAGEGAGGQKEVQQVSAGAGLSSELFIARVLRVEPVSLIGDDEQCELPLLYHRRRYTTVEGHAKP